MHKDFARSFDSLTAVYEFAEKVFATREIEQAVRFPVHLAIEELFTNMVKYNPDTDSEIGVDIVVDGGGVIVTLTEDDVDEFDVTRPRRPNVDAPLEERNPGGLGLHLLHNIVDRLEYEYHDRHSRVVFTKGAG